VLSVLIVNWNTRELLSACLASFRAHPGSIEREIIVVDNASSDGSAAMVRTDFPEVQLIQSGGNLGYAAGNNIAFAAAKGEFLLTLNPDTELLDDSLDRAVKLLEDHPKVGVLGARQIGTDGKTQRSIRGFPTLTGIFGDLTGLGRRFPGTRLDSYRLSSFDYELEQSAPQPMGTFLLFRRSAIETVGDSKAPFDLNFPIFFNEVDLLYRLTRAGWSCLYAPTVRILHHGGESTKQVRKSMIWESHKSLVRYLLKVSNGPLQRATYALAGAAIYAAAFVRAKGYDPGFKK
jgi:GT2 family glycosyltransferase